jgi:hypothetical protein
MDSAVLGLASPLMVDVKGMMLGFEQSFALDDAIGSHACLVEASISSEHVCAISMYLGSPLSYRWTL